MPKVGAFSDRDISLMFYDGGESLRNLEEYAVVAHPRGHSCEEVGGAGCIVDGEWKLIKWLSRNVSLTKSALHGQSETTIVPRTVGVVLCIWL